MDEQSAGERSKYYTILLLRESAVQGCTPGTISYSLDRAQITNRQVIFTPSVELASHTHGCENMLDKHLHIHM